MTIDLPALRLLAQAATPGPWRSHAGTSTVNNGRACIADCDQFMSEVDNNRNANFIAAASPDVLIALLDRLEKAEFMKDQMAEGLREIADMSSKLREVTTGGTRTLQTLIDIETQAIGALAEAPPSASPQSIKDRAHE